MDLGLFKIKVPWTQASLKLRVRIGNSVVRSDGLPTKATITDEGHLAGTFCSKTVFNLS